MMDHEIKDMIYDVLKRNLEFEIEHITVSVRNGEVTLLGFVEDRSQKFAVAREIEFLEEVKSLSNDLEMKRPFHGLFPGAEEEQNRLVNNRTGMI